MLINKMQMLHLDKIHNKQEIALHGPGRERKEKAQE